ncbi:NAD-dependent epimerase/dehydratase family protein [bacterium]|nr:NAD-dependent epimerase/dehydratase family protein [bacterium]
MIAITGISGYIGFHLAHYLKQEKQNFLGLIKKNTNQDDINLLEQNKFQYKFVDFNDEDTMAQALKDVDIIVHLIGSIYRPKQMTMEQMHKDITSIMVRAAIKNKVKKIIYISAIGSKKDAESEYHKTKALAEQEIINSGIPYVVLRPSLIFGKMYGRRNSKLIDKLAQSISNLPFIPVIGSGKNKLQPLFVMDLARCIFESINPKITGVTIEIGGPEILPFDVIAKKIAKSINMDKKTLVKIPKPIAAMLACVMEKISAQPKITRDQIRMTKNDNVCSSNLSGKYFSFTKKSMNDILKHLV